MYAKSFILFAVVLGLVSTLSAEDASPAKVEPKKVPAPTRTSRMTLNGALLKNAKAEAQSKKADGRYSYIYESNMPWDLEYDVMAAIDDSYYYSNDAVTVSQYVQSFLDSWHPQYYWNVVINYEAASFYNYYYAVVVRNSDTILVFA